MNRYGELRSGLSMLIATGIIFGVQFLLSLALIFNWMFTANGYDGSMQFIFDIALNPWTYIGANLLTILAIPLLFVLLYKRPLSQMGLHPKHFGRQLSLGLLFGAAAISAVFGIYLLTDSVRIVSVNLNALSSPTFWATLIMFLAVGFGEEIAYRGYMMTAAKTARSKGFVLFVPAVLFAFMHITNPGLTLLSLFNIFCAGLIMALLFVKTGRLWSSVGFHITWNFMQGCIFGMNVSGRPTASILQVEFNGRDYFSGGSFGAEGSLIATGIIILCVLFTAFVLRDSKDRPWTYTSGLPFSKHPPVQPLNYYYPTGYYAQSHIPQAPLSPDASAPPPDRT